jgi:hypothetical protein
MFHWKKNTLSLALGGILGNHSGYSLIDQNYMSYSQHPEIAIHEYEPRDLSWSWQAGAIFTHDFSIRGTPFSSLAGIHFRHIEDRRPLRAPEDFPRRDIDNDIPFIAYYGSRQYDSILTASLSIQRLDQHKIGVSKVILGINPFFGITLREAVISLEKKGTTRTDYRLSYGPDSIVDPQIVSWQSQGDFQELLADIQPEFFFGKYISIGFPAEYASRVQSVICTKSVLEKGIMRESSYGFAAVLYGRLSLFSDFMLEASLETGKLIYYSTNKESGAWRYQGYRGKIRLELAGNL